MDTLVLNYAYMPVSRVPWQQAFCDVFTGRAEIVEEYNDWYVHSANDVWLVPSVIRFVAKTALFRRGIKFNRNNVWMRDRGRCQYCGSHVSRAEFTYDHVVPRSQSGRTRWENIVVSCIPCNQRKGNRTPEQARMRLLTTPVRPRSLPGVSFPVLRWDESMPPTWRDYLGSAQYWHGQLTDDG